VVLFCYHAAAAAADDDDDDAGDDVADELSQPDAETANTTEG